MGYYIRVLGTQDPDIHTDEFIYALNTEGLSAKFLFDPCEEPGKWTIIDICNPDGEPIAQLERNPVIDGETGQEELDEFREDIQEYKPVSAVKWLTGYFNKVKVIYAFQLLNAAFEDGNYEIIGVIRTTIGGKVRGIFQADNEGFSNGQGDLILWQFSDKVTGEWNCAVRNWLGKWTTFVMETGDAVQQREFQEGKVPKNAKRL